MSASKMSKWQEFQLVFHIAKNGHKFCAGTTRAAAFSWSRFFIIAIFFPSSASVSGIERQLQQTLNWNAWKQTNQQVKSMCYPISIHFFDCRNCCEMCTCFAIANTYAKHIGTSRLKSFFLEGKNFSDMFTRLLVFTSSL